MRRKTVRDEEKTIPLREWEMREAAIPPWVFLWGGMLALTLLVVVLAFLGGSR